MRNPRSLRNSIDWLAEGPFAPHIDAYKQYLTERGYASNTFSNCMRSVAHFAQWTRSRRLLVRRIDESVVAEFLDKHLAAHCFYKAYGITKSRTSHAFELALPKSPDE